MKLKILTEQNGKFRNLGSNQTIAFCLRTSLCFAHVVAAALYMHIFQDVGGMMNDKNNTKTKPGHLRSTG